MLFRSFDAKTRTLVSIIFLIQRGLAVGLSLAAPAIVLTVILGWPDKVTTIVMGIIVVAYTVTGGVQAVTWTDFQQMLIMLFGLGAALFTAIWLLPDGIGFTGALTVAGAAGRINPVTTAFTWTDRYNIWSGLFGGMFLALSYFGCDQSQVQRYLTGKSIAQSRLSLLFNAMANVKIVHVPFKGSPPAFAALLGGQVEMLFDAIGTMLPHIKSGAIRPLAVSKLNTVVQIVLAAMVLAAEELARSGRLRGDVLVCTNTDEE